MDTLIFLFILHVHFPFLFCHSFKIFLLGHVGMVPLLNVHLSAMCDKWGKLSLIPFICKLNFVLNFGTPPPNAIDLDISVLSPRIYLSKKQQASVPLPILSHFFAYLSSARLSKIAQLIEELMSSSLILFATKLQTLKPCRQHDWAALLGGWSRFANHMLEESLGRCPGNYVYLEFCRHRITNQDTAKVAVWDVCR